MDLIEQIEKMDWELSQKDPERHAEITAAYEDMLAKLYTDKPVYLTESETPVEEIDEEVRALRWYKDALEAALSDNARQRSQPGSGIEAAKVIVPIGKGKEVEARAIAEGLQAFTEPYPEDGVDEVIIEAADEANLFAESLLVQAIGETPYSEVQVFVPDSLLTSAHAKLLQLGIPDARQLNETEWAPGATYETRY